MGRGEGKNKKTREQSGCFHVILTSNYQNLIFTDSLERYRFLELTQKYLSLYNAKIFGFCLMDTHVHMLIETQKLSTMMGSLLREFSYWYNKRHQQKGNIFQKPFKSYPKNSTQNQLYTLLYILCNPYVDGLCSNPRYYIWSSYNYYFGDPKRLSNYIQVDKSIILNSFKSSEDLWRAATINPLSSGKQRPSPTSPQRTSPPSPHRDYIPKFGGDTVTDSMVLAHAKKLMQGSSIYDMPHRKIKELVIELRQFPGASVRQISSALHVSKLFVLNVLKAPPKPPLPKPPP